MKCRNHETAVMRLKCVSNQHDYMMVVESMDLENEQITKNRFPSWLAPALIYALSVACLIWVYRDFDWDSELPKLKHMHWGWIAVAVTTDIFVYVIQAWRWNILLSPVVNAPLGRSVQAIYIGLFANEVLPLRSGEAIRCYLQALWSKISFPV